MSSGDVMMSVTSAEAVRQAELLTLRQISDSLQNLYAEQVKHSDVLYSVKEDVAVLKMRMEDTKALENKIVVLEAKISNLELRNAKEDGGKGMAVTLSDVVYKFGPWTAMLALGIYEFIIKHP